MHARMKILLSRIFKNEFNRNDLLGKIIPNSPADQCGQLFVNDQILAVNGIDLSHMLHTDVVNLIKESGRTIKLTIGPPAHHGKTIHWSFIVNSIVCFLVVENDRAIENQNPSNGIRPSSSSSIVISDGNNQTLRNAFSHNLLNTTEKYFEFLPRYLK